MDSKHISQGIINALFKIGLITSGIFLLIELKILLIYIVVAAIITLIGRPIVLFLKKLKLSNLLAASFLCLFWEVLFWNHLSVHSINNSTKRKLVFTKYQ